MDVIEALTETLKSRKGASADDSYVASLYQSGLNKMLEKVGEEATETILAAKDAEQTGDADHLVHETADLWFHTMVMLVHLGRDPAEVLAELERRFGVGGHEEKAARR